LSATWFPPIPSDERVLALEADIEGVFAVREVSLRSRGQVIVFVGQFLVDPEQVFAAITDRFKARGFVPLLRNEDGRDVLIAYPAPAVRHDSKPWLHLLLFVATVLSVLLAGTWQALPPTASADSLSDLGRLLVQNWRLGIPFTVALLGILGIHELGHYFVARHYGLRVTLPYFIPFPVNLFTGTLGAVIRISSPFESRKALFDVGIAGPLAGLAVAVPVVVVGLAQANLVPVPQVPDGSVTVFNEPLLFQWIATLVRGPRAAGYDFEMNPLLMAGWWGFFITALNLLPVSQLDGGHISYAMFGNYHRYVAWGMFIVAALVAVVTNPGYILMLGLVFFMGIEHPPALNDLTPIGRWRWLLGLIALALFLLLITPDPFSF
jgi:membrane-associated protease RseP (regulator of RpoE activity)